MRISARNQLEGIVRRVRKGAIMAEVQVEAEPASVTAVITVDSVDRLQLAEGDRVTIIVKATEVMVGKE